MFKFLLISIALAVLVSGCASPKERKISAKKEPVTKMMKKKSIQKRLGRKEQAVKLCENIKSLKKGMSLEEVHDQLGLGDNKKYSFTKPIFYIKCYEEDMIISYAKYKFFFNEGCTFIKQYAPDEKEVEESVCSGRAGELGPPEIFKY